MFVRRASLLLVSLFAVLFAACGGSDGSITTPPSPPPPPPPPPPNTAALPITADNAQDITVAVLNAVTSAADLLGVADVIGLPVLSGPSPGVSKPSASDIHTVVTACDTGEFTTDWDDADNDFAVSTGDSFSTTFDLCFFQDQDLTVDGDSTVTDLVVTGDPFTPVAPYGLVATFGFVDLAATDSVETVTINGDLDLDISSDDDVTINAALGSTLLSVDVDGSLEELSDYLMSQIIDQNALTQTITAGGTFASDVLEGSVTFETLEDFLVMGEDNPSAGQLFISDDMSSVLVTVMDNMNVRLEIDLDLDGMIDDTIDLTWDELNLN